MRTFIFFTLFLGVGLWLGLGLYEDPGYALLSYDNVGYEMPLWFLFTMVLVGFFASYLLLQTLSALLTTPKRIRGWNHQRLANRAKAKTIRGLIELTEGNWKKAEDLLSKSRDKGTSLLNYLGAARAAQEQGAYDRRDEYLRLAHTHNPQADIAVGLSQAQLQLAHGQLEQSLATLTHLQAIAPKHATVLKLLKRLYEQLHDWKKLYDLLPKLKKYTNLSDDQYKALEKQVFAKLLSTYETLDNKEKLNELWRRAPYDVQQDPKFVSRYVDQLIKLGVPHEAEIILRDCIKKQWDDRLVRLYGLLPGADYKEQLNIAESWLEGQTSNATLLLTLGRLCLQNHLWGKAKRYFEASIAAAPTCDAYRELGLLLDSLGEQEESTACFRKGLLLDVTALEWPMPQRKEVVTSSEDKRPLIIGA